MALPDLTDEQRGLLERVRCDFEIAEEEHKPLRDRWDGFWRQYHSYTDLKRSHAEASPRDRDGIVRDAKRQWGATLYIPYTFTVVETIVPRMLSNRPRMLWLPTDQDSARNTENMRWLMDRQQQQCDYELRLQTTAKTGLICGLGVQKVYWKRVLRNTKAIAPAIYGNGWVETPVSETVWDDPFVEDVDIYDFLWDPFGSSMETVGFVVHRTWRSTAYVLDKLRSGEWDLLPGASLVEASDIQATGKGRYDEVWRGRKQAQGYGTSTSRGCVHEVWEYHGGGEVITVLDRQWPVRRIANPAWHGELPFHIYRPTEVPGRMVGKGEPEPIQDLQREMNTLRSQRRDNATLKLQQSYFYEDGSLDPAEIQFGAGLLHAVSPQTSLREALVPMQVGDIPNSGYQEEQALQADIERATGVSDQTAGSGVQQATATGAQLVQAAANVRIQYKTRRLELELCKSEARQWLRLDQQHITENRTVRVPQVPQPGLPDSVWAWRQVGPAEIAGEWEIEPEGGATAPDNVPQDRQDAQMLATMFAQDPNVDHRKITQLTLEKSGIKRPEAYMSPEQFVPPQTLDLIAQGLEQQGLPPDAVTGLIKQALDAARARSGQVPDQQLQPQQAVQSSGQPAG